MRPKIFMKIFWRGFTEKWMDGQTVNKTGYPEPDAASGGRLLKLRHFRTDLQTDGLTDGQTDGQTDGHTLL